MQVKEHWQYIGATMVDEVKHYVYRCWVPGIGPTTLHVRADEFWPGVT